MKPNLRSDLRELNWRMEVDTSQPHWVVSQYGNLKLVFNGVTLAQVSFCFHESDWSAHVGNEDHWDVGSLQKALDIAGKAYPNAPFLGPLSIKKRIVGCPTCERDRSDW